MKKQIIAVILIGFATFNCSIFKEKEKRKNEVSFYKISSMPVRALDYKPHKKYINDYEIITSRKLSDSDTVKLSQILLSDSLMIKDNNHRSCEFLPVYALKWSSGKTILISLSPCAKIQVTNKASDPIVVNDLRDHSGLESWVLKKDTTTLK